MYGMTSPSRHAHTRTRRGIQGQSSARKSESEESTASKSSPRHLAAMKASAWACKGCESTVINGWMPECVCVCVCVCVCLTRVTSTHLEDGPDLLDDHAVLARQLVQEEEQRLGAIRRSTHDRPRRPSHMPDTCPLVTQIKSNTPTCCSPVPPGSDTSSSFKPCVRSRRRSTKLGPAAASPPPPSCFLAAAGAGAVHFLDEMRDVGLFSQLKTCVCDPIVYFTVAAPGGG